PFDKDHRSTLVSWMVLLLLVSVVPMPARSFPIFSYGLMLLIGFLSALLLAQRRGLREGIKPELLFDMAFWVLVCGILGARLFYLIQYHEEVFAGKQGMDLLFAAVNLSQGGIVLYGSLLGGGAAFFWFCWKH